jgi:hypothetical protein
MNGHGQAPPKFLRRSMYPAWCYQERHAKKTYASPTLIFQVVITSRILTERDSHEFATSAVTSEIGEKWITEAFNWHQLEVRHQAQAQDSKASEIWRPNTRCSRSFSGTGVCMNHDCVDNDSLSFIPLHVVLWPGQPVLDCVLEWVSKYPARHMKQPVNRVIL